MRKKLENFSFFQKLQITQIIDSSIETNYIIQKMKITFIMINNIIMLITESINGLK